MNIFGAKGAFSLRELKKNGGEIRDYTKMMTESREQVIDWMIEEAGILTYGTAVIGE